MATTMYLAPHKAMTLLVDAGVLEKDAIAHLVRLKDTEFCVRYDGTSYFDPRELNRILRGSN